MIGRLLTLSSMTPLIAQTDFSTYEQQVPGSDYKIKMIPIQSGSFVMGSPSNQTGREADEGNTTEVSVSAFWIGAYEITFGQYEAYCEQTKKGNPDAITGPSTPYEDPSHGMGKYGFPASSMTHFAALNFCKWLYLKTGTFYRLPTEAEWEYACRAGSTTSYPFGKKRKHLSQYAWFEKNSDGKYQKVGQLKSNAWGLYDMLGNVAEWTIDQYVPDYYEQIKGKKQDPIILPTKLHPRSVRGGSYLDDAVALRSANRIESDIEWKKRDPQIPKSFWWNTDSPFVGFRIVRPKKQLTKREVKAFFERHLNE